MTSPTPLQYGQHDHIYNRGNNGENIFVEERNHQQFGNLLNANAKATNRAYQRTGTLFQNPFGRMRVASDAHFHRHPDYRRRMKC